jgi:hypothetical protein
MSVVQPEPQPDAQQQLAKALEENKLLQQKLAAATTAYANALKPTPKSSKFTNGLKKFGASLLAVFSTPEAVKAEKSLAVIALGRALILLPSLGVVIDVILAALGAPSVGVK